MNGPVESQKPSTSVRNAKVRTGIKKKSDSITQEELKRHLNYNPKNGVFTWVCESKGRRDNQIAGCVCKKEGYVRIKICGVLYLSHRLAWLFMEGFLPEHEIDHKNGIRSDNRWENLRHVSRRCNLQNLKKSSKNTSGFPGVSWAGSLNLWSSSIKINRKSTHLGYYGSPLEAALARFTVEQQCDKWKCNCRSELVKAIKAAWPGFKTEVA